MPLSSAPWVSPSPARNQRRTSIPSAPDEPKVNRPASGYRAEMPRPIGLHLTIALTSLMSSVAALPSARLGLLPWHPKLAKTAADLTGQLMAADPEKLTAAMAQVLTGRLGGLIAGIERYQNHPYRRDLPEPPILWRRGAARLFDYGGGSGRPVFMVPSLVNRYYVLDLSRRRSFARWLVGRGYRPLIIDWGTPGAMEQTFDLSDYVLGHLADAFDCAAALGDGPMPVVGYCMGGNLALALALARPQQTKGLALLAAPWDFHADDGPSPMANMAGQWENLVSAFPALPVDLLQTLFALLDPNLALRKFNHFATLDQASAAALDFVALEDWLNDGVPLVQAAARNCLVGWYGNNEPARGNWRIGGMPVVPEHFEGPALVAAPEQDRIVPARSARPLGRALPNARMIAPPSGHIGMMVGSRAEAGLWTDIVDWMDALPS